MPTRSHPTPRLACALACALLALASCASVSFDRDTQTSGTFKSKGFAVTLLSIDLPKGALDIARENAADANLANMVVREVTVTPDLGWFDWILDIVGMRWATVQGTWGFAPE
jgi:hypothetical protein